MASKNEGRSVALIGLIVIVIAVAVALPALEGHAHATTVSTTALPSTTTIPTTTMTNTVSTSGSGTLAGMPYYYASNATSGSVHATPSSGTSFICEASVACDDGIQNYSWAQDASNSWCDTYGNCGEFDSIGHQSVNDCSLGIVDCPYPASQPEAVGAMGIRTSEQYTLYTSVSSPLSYKVSNSTDFVAVMVSCVQNGVRPCSIPKVPTECTVLFATSYGNKASGTIGPVLVYGAVCASQKAGNYTVSVQNYTYYTAAAYAYHS
jgi:hypothetical protein